MHKTRIVAHFYLLVSIIPILTTATPITLPLTSGQGLNFVGAQAKFGSRLTSAGDINGDGIGDILIGDPDEFGSNGAVYVIYGSETSLTDLDATALSNLAANNKGFIIKGDASSELGSSVSYAGDVNGDNIADIIIGAPNDNSGAGAAYVIFGKTSGLSDLDLATGIDLTSGNRGFKLTGPAGSNLGTSVSNAGDVNKDGFDDITIGASGYQNQDGAFCVMYGKGSGFDNVVFTPTGSVSSTGGGFKIIGGTASKFGSSVRGIGDINGDGYHDVIVGAFGYAAGQGYAAVFFGNVKSALSDLTVYPGSSFPANRGFRITTTLYCQLGKSVSGAGDINDDGLSDFIIGGPMPDSSLTITNGGFAFVIYGRTTPFSDIIIDPTLELSPSSAGFRITSGLSNTYLGVTASNIGDFNADGIDDIIIGASGSSGVQDGAAYVIFGSGTALSHFDGLTPTTFNDPTKGFVISPIDDTRCVSSCGDFNGDRGQDILIGAKSTGSTFGAAYLLFGTPPPEDNLPDPSEPSGAPAQTVDSSEAAVLNAITQAFSAASKAVSAAITSISIINFGNPAAAILGSLSESIYFIKYLNINYPPRLQYILDNYQSEDLITIENISSAPQTMIDEMGKHRLPEKFEKHEDGLHSSFLINFWSPLLTLLFLIVIIIITGIFKSCNDSNHSGSKFKKSIRWTLARLVHMIKWNLILSKFTGYYGDISLFASLELRTVQFSSFLQVISFLVCLLVLFVILAIQVKTLLVVSELQKAKNQAKQRDNAKILENTKNRLKQYEIIFESFKEDSFLQQSLFFFFNIRIFIFYAIISWLDHALVQTSLNTAMEVIMLLYLAISRPLKQKLELVQYIVIETIFLLVNICTFALAVLDFHQLDAGETRIMFGEIIIYCNGGFLGCALLFLSVSVLLLFKDSFTFIKHLYRKKPVQIIKHRQHQLEYHHNDADNSTMSLNSHNISELVHKDHSHKNSGLTREETSVSPYSSPIHQRHKSPTMDCVPVRENQFIREIDNTSIVENIQPFSIGQFRTIDNRLDIRKPPGQEMPRKRIRREFECS